MENYYLLTLFPGLLEQKKERSGGKVGLKSIKLLPADPLNLPGLLEQKKRKEAEARGVEKYIQDVKHFLCRICKQKMDFETLWKKTYKKCISLRLAMEMLGW